MKVMKLSPTHRPPLSSRRYPWYSFPSEAESTPGHEAARWIKPMRSQLQRVRFNMSPTIQNCVLYISRCCSPFVCLFSPLQPMPWSPKIIHQSCNTRDLRVTVKCIQLNKNAHFNILQSMHNEKKKSVKIL